MSNAEMLAAKRMRMLRLGAGWTAEELALASARAGVNSLDRGTIAKIESNTRRIQVTEVGGVARVFGLTSTDLLEAAPEVFLSYAQQDSAVGQEVFDWLGDHGFLVRSPERAAAGLAVRSLSAAIDSAHAFVGLLSPAFLASPESTSHLDLAARRHQRARLTDFVHLLKVTEVPNLDASTIYSYRPIDLPQAGTRKRGEALSRLGSAILRGHAASTGSNLATPREDWPEFLNRREELDRIWGGLTSQVGPHFWLVTGPPGMGKTPFLARLRAMADEQAEERWATALVDLRTEAECLGDAMAIIGKLFQVERSGDPEDDLRAIAREIIRSGRPYLCLLDTAELASPDVVPALRHHLSQIYQHVLHRDPNARLTFVVASRRDDGWRGVLPNPRLAMMPFAEFDLDAVQEAVNDLASRMGSQRSPAELRADAAVLHRSTEGVPALVQRGLEWIRAEEGLEIERLEDPDVFDAIIRPFIKRKLLALDSLLPDDSSQSETSETRLRIVEQALKRLVLYRFFTLSHLRRLSSDEPFAAAMAEADWSDLDLWQAIGRCSLLVRPLDEPWQEIHPSIRRLLFRHFYTRAERTSAHRDAAEFTEQWSAKQSGREQVMGLIDCIWHEAAGMSGDLTEYVRERARIIGDSGLYTENELRVYAADRMRNDDELRSEFAGDAERFERIVRIVEGTSSHGGVT